MRGDALHNIRHLWLALPDYAQATVWILVITVALIISVALLTLFGVFEKKRPEVLALVGSLREWEQ